MTSFAINLDSIKREMIRDEQFSGDKGDTQYTVTYGAFGKQITVQCRAHTPFDDADVTYYVPSENPLETDDYEEMFELVAQMFLAWLLERPNAY